MNIELGLLCDGGVMMVSDTPLARYRSARGILPRAAFVHGGL